MKYFVYYSATVMVSSSINIIVTFIGLPDKVGIHTFSIVIECKNGVAAVASGRTSVAQ